MSEGSKKHNITYFLPSCLLKSERHMLAFGTDCGPPPPSPLQVARDSISGWKLTVHLLAKLFDFCAASEKPVARGSCHSTCFVCLVQTSPA